MQRLRLVWMVVASLATLAALLTVGPISTTYAVPPERQVFEFEDSIPLIGLCDFQVTIHVQGTLIVTTFFDDEGDQLAQTILTPRLEVTLSAGNNTLIATSPAPERIDLVENTAVFTGLQFRFVDPVTREMLFVAAGREVIDLTTGRGVSFTGLRVLEQEALCEALTP